MMSGSRFARAVMMIVTAVIILGLIASTVALPGTV
jgi:hypothetical protein